LSSLAHRENRWEAYEQFAARAGIPLEPSELWLLARIGELEPVTVAELSTRLRLDVPALARQIATLGSRSLVTDAAGEVRLAPAGMEVRERARATRSSDLNELLAGWKPERHAEIRRIVDELARSFASEVPKRVPAT
jgi:DNA-binding MarR family transcriptional regulator